ncbi:Hypothetical protein CAP_3150 [Chondromyces apiculatus DSM 436]|uniref:Beta-lactamase class A catalytic domain-containing protein n=1 Tax=Chondromyces apiculatus DSM 436 TaxID=1192034 RepID=A0A017T9L3_9BACT|nr:Hypothetical protein CAP_3150 [Chondromyces apiculatus DSM 436]
MREAQLDRVIDLGLDAEKDCTERTPCKGAPLARTPSVDLAVVAFPQGCPPVGASVILSAGTPDVRVNAIDPSSVEVRGVRFRRWNPARWDGAPTAPRVPSDDVVPGLAGVDFDLPYPASLFKLLVAVQVLRLVERGTLTLDQPVFDGHAGRPLRAWLDDMITRSDNTSTRALVRKLHALGAMDEVTPYFAALGLPTLQIRGTSPVTGGDWHPGQIHMGAWDTARLLWLIDPSAPPPSWPMAAPFLGEASRQRLFTLLSEQAFHEALSTPALCGTWGVRQGIPARMPPRWIHRDGSVNVDELRRSTDARPCNASAEVAFAHKTGLTLNYGSDAGIVTGIPGRARRHYLVALVSNLGYRYTDAEHAGGPLPCLAKGVCYTQRIPALGARLDALMKSLLE